MDGVRGAQAQPGEFRAVQNWIGAGSGPRDATFVPPPVTQMHEALDAFEKYLHAASPLPPLVQLALVHYQFEAIHPFSDGNGRVGRLLLSLILLTERLLPEPLLYLSAFFERHRREYYDHLLAVSQAGRWEPWIRFVLTGVDEQAREAAKSANNLFDLRDEWKTKLREMEASENAHHLAERLFSYPGVTVADVAREFRLTQRGAAKVIDKLVEAQILEEVTGRARNRVFLASQVMRLVQGDRPRQETTKVSEKTQT